MQGYTNTGKIFLKLRQQIIKRHLDWQLVALGHSMHRERASEMCAISLLTLRIILLDSSVKGLWQERILMSPLKAYTH